jgi:hypothetical protein
MERKRNARYVMKPEHFEIIKKELKSRWLITKELYALLHSVRRLKVPLQKEFIDKPRSGQWFMYDASMRTSIRKDGYEYIRSINSSGQKVFKERHISFSLDSKDVISCYYSTRQDRPSFTRSIYWLSTTEFEGWDEVKATLPPPIDLDVRDDGCKGMIFVHYLDDPSVKIPPELYIDTKISLPVSEKLVDDKKSSSSSSSSSAVEATTSSTSVPTADLSFQSSSSLLPSVSPGGTSSKTLRRKKSSLSNSALVSSSASPTPTTPSSSSSTAIWSSASVLTSSSIGTGTDISTTCIVNPSSSSSNASAAASNSASGSATPTKRLLKRPAFTLKLRIGPPSVSSPATPISPSPLQMSALSLQDPHSPVILPSTPIPHTSTSLYGAHAPLLSSSAHRSGGGRGGNSGRHISTRGTEIAPIPLSQFQDSVTSVPMPDPEPPPLELGSRRSVASARLSQYSIENDDSLLMRQNQTSPSSLPLINVIPMPIHGLIDNNEGDEEESDDTMGGVKKQRRREFDNDYTSGKGRIDQHHHLQQQHQQQQQHQHQHQRHHHQQQRAPESLFDDDDEQMSLSTVQTMISKTVLSSLHANPHQRKEMETDESQLFSNPFHISTNASNSSSFGVHVPHDTQPDFDPTLLLDKYTDSSSSGEDSDDNSDDDFADVEEDEDDEYEYEEFGFGMEDDLTAREIETVSTHPRGLLSLESATDKLLTRVVQQLARYAALPEQGSDDQQRQQQQEQQKQQNRSTTHSIDSQTTGIVIPISSSSLPNGTTALVKSSTISSASPPPPGPRQQQSLSSLTFPYPSLSPSSSSSPSSAFSRLQPSLMRGGGGGGGGDGLDSMTRPLRHPRSLSEADRTVLVESFSSLSMREKITVARALAGLNEPKDSTTSSSSIPLSHGVINSSTTMLSIPTIYSADVSSLSTSTTALTSSRVDDGFGSQHIAQAILAMNPEELVALDAEARLVQSNVRAWLVRRNYNHLKQAARTLQIALRRRKRENVKKTHQSHQPVSSSAVSSSSSTLIPLSTESSQLTLGVCNSLDEQKGGENGNDDDVLRLQLDFVNTSSSTTKNKNSSSSSNSSSWDMSLNQPSSTLTTNTSTVSSTLTTNKLLMTSSMDTLVTTDIDSLRRQAEAATIIARALQRYRGELTLAKE